MEKRDRFLLVAINAKYIHSNLAVYSLAAYARAAGIEAEFAEYTINHQIDVVLRDIYEKQPDVIGFSCYIWNMDFVMELAEELHKIMPQVPIWMGGPEVSWNPEERLAAMPFVTGIMIGEGEETFQELASYYQNGKDFNKLASYYQNGENFSKLQQINGLCFRDDQGQIFKTAFRPLLSMDDIPFPYGRLSEYKNRIIYYESSRGCPFSCSYCLSSVEKKLRFRSLPLVFEELAVFLREKTAQVKFVDRTFNCRHEHAYAIWKYILEHDNGVTNFHFEIAADLLREEDFELFRKMRPGLIQLEIGVQTTNSKTIEAIGRKMNLQKVAQCTEKVRNGGNIHQHLDLIAGLPWEDLKSFAKSFNDVYAMKPNQLQLGFLKVLHGTRMEKEVEEHGLVYRSHPAYEVLYTRWLSFSDVLQLKNVEETVEEYYNSGQFSVTLSYVVPLFETPFDFYSRFGAFLQKQGYRSVSQNRVGRYMALRHFLQEILKEVEKIKETAGGYTKETIRENIEEKVKETAGKEAEKTVKVPANWQLSMQLVDELLSYDFCLREKLNRIPDFIPDQEPYKKQVSDFFAREMHEGNWFGQEARNSSYRQLRGRFQPLIFQRNIQEIVNGMIGEVTGKTADQAQKTDEKDTKQTQAGDRMSQGPWLALFDYESRSPMDHNAQVTFILLEEV